MPEIVTLMDYDGYFTRLVEGMVAVKIRLGQPFKHKRIQITAGPYRSHAVTTESHPECDQIDLDFYSALRTGFGELSEQDIKQIIERL